MQADSFVYVPKSVLAHVCTFGEARDGPFDGMLVFGGIKPDPLPTAIQGALLGHIQRGERIVLITHTEEQMSWVKAVVALLTAPGGRRSGSNRTESAFQSLNGRGLLARDKCAGLCTLNPFKNQAFEKPPAINIRDKFSTLVKEINLLS